MPKLKVIIGLALMIAGAVLTVFFWSYRGHRLPTPLFWCMASVLSALWGLRMVLTGFAQDEEQFINTLDEGNAAFIAGAQRITVDLAKCEVMENNYSERAPDDDKYEEATSPDYQPRTREVVQSVIVADVVVQGTERRYHSGTLPYDRATLLFKMFAQKTTALYVDPADPDRYLLDISFLSESM